MMEIRQNRGDGEKSLSPRPDEVHWDIQDKYAAIHFADEVLTTGEAKLLIDQVHSFGQPYPVLVFEGRNPFARKDLPELIQYAAEKQLYAVVTAEPGEFTEENLKAIKEAGAKGISIHLEGTPETEQNNILHQARFFLTLKAAQLARLIGLSIRIVTTVKPDIVTFLPQIFRLVNRMGASTWKLLFPVTKRGETRQGEVGAADFEAILNFAYDASFYINLEVSEPRHFNRVIAKRLILSKKGLGVEVLKLAPLYEVLRTSFRKIEFEEDLIRRSAGRYRVRHLLNPVSKSVYVSNNGDVCPEGFLNRKVGNLRYRSLIDIYQNSWLFVALRDISKGEGLCGICEFNDICGGNKARAFMLTDDPTANEPFCNHVPGSFGFRKEIEEIAKVG